MKFFKILTYLLAGLFSSYKSGSTSSGLGNMKEIKYLPNRKSGLMATVNCRRDKAVNQSSSPVKESFLSEHFEISHDTISNQTHGISRIVKGIDFHFLTCIINKLKLVARHYLDKGMNYRPSNRQYPSFLTKKLYIPNGNLQLLNFYVINDYIRHENGTYKSYT
ncbi:MAG: hypothetical protein KJO05_09280 [Bacteroidia bacterium]|nr:hypothetical protein [Bacteroidia bacterium]NNK55118.1 hypothetical protein [Flavobacteriaceae bacterium]